MKRAYHDIILPDGTFQHGPIVIEVDEDDHFIGWHRLEQEEPFSEWIGGTYKCTE